MRHWATAAIAAASGPGRVAGGHALAAAREALSAGAVTTAYWYLADAARYGAAADAVAQLDALPPPAAQLCRARAAGIRARAAGEPAPLLAAAEQHLELGLLGGAAELAELAAAAGPGADRAAAVRLEARRRLGLGEPAAEPVTTTLTRRELEIARLAARGMTDRDIAESLVVSVRTVESHLAAAYRKLGIRSRRALAGTFTDPDH
jgi:DNA-binding CsgD family transcriptional regulator